MTRSRPAANAATATVRVGLGERAYDIVIGSGVLDDVGTQLAAVTRPGQAVVISNPVVGGLFRARVTAALATAGFRVAAIEIPDGEEHKNLAWVAFAYERLIEAHADRSTPVLALGGGVIGDLAGFVAATYLRGVPFVQLPTTLLAQVDSSVGGKTGVNLPAGKNLIGAFYQPRLVLSDIAALHSLPKREFLAGLAEVIKYGIILDAELFALVETELARVMARDEGLLRTIVRRCCELKATVVERDEREADHRAILNFGHTLGHAIEALTDYRRFLHGEAVAIGMAFAARVSRSRGFCDDETVRRIVTLLTRAGLPVAVPPDAAGQALVLAIETDKKVAGGKVKFVCVEAVGRSRFELLAADVIAAQATA
ncbi:3-dehydroquinate synthase [Candidatus Binatia bacterium]|nr:3-dehydroquinate synthase [Candidatus Binatia bacterium]